ncbi:MAG: 2-hydroxy-3-oxopropionate reductase [Acidobacteria bacterium]|nr:2-hydroxy-3-oxopropionate reductase [Acidobacteriota bacterium]
MSEEINDVAEKIGFIGLGVMGKPMAKHLVAAGHQLTVHNRSRGAVDELAAAGATAAASPADVAKASTIVITMLPDTPDVERVLTGPGGVVESMQRGTVVVDMSSISPIATERLAKAIAEKGGSMLDAPVSGGEIGAINAALSIMVGGDEATFHKMKPVLDKMGNPERVVYIGRSGAGQICKICNQIAIGGALAGVSEAFALAKKAGVDAARVRQALLGGFAASRVLEVHGERMLVDNYKPGFRARLYQKDLRLASEAAAANGVALPGTAVVAQLLNALIASGGGDLDYAALGTVLFKLAGQP